MNLYNSIRIFIVSVFILIIYIVYTIYNEPQQQVHVLNLEEIDIVLENEYLVNNSKCKIKNVNPYNSEVLKYIYHRDYVDCNDNKPLLTYIEIRNDQPVLKINQSVIPIYSNFYVYCCYQNVYRKYDATNPDGHIRSTSRCERFDNETYIKSDVVKVKCQNFWHRVYENTHTVIMKHKKILEKIEKFNATTKPLSVLFVGIDSISRINFIRMLPKTRSFLLEKQWFEIKGYNKMGDNTFPNLMAVFTGKNESYAFETCHPYTVGGLDKCDLIWYDYRKAGYITAYAEDESSINTFNYLKKGFNETPTDFYFRPYFIASEELSVEFVDGSRYCTGPETSGERVLNLAKDFAKTFVNDPSFGVFWTNSFSHNDVTTPSMMDGKIYEFFRDLEEGGVLKSSMIVFLSDHGIRFGDIRKTRTGWFEERLPFLYIWLPEWFRDKHPNVVENLRRNENILTTPYDLFHTLQDVMVYSDRKHVVRPSSACKTCASLFDKIKEERNCSESGIDAHWCTCESYNSVDSNDLTVKEATKFVISEINSILKRERVNDKCHEYTLDAVLSSNVSEKQGNQNKVYLLMIKTEPSAIFEATVRVVRKKFPKMFDFSLQGSISRLDWYKHKSSCVSRSKQYCVCKILYF